MVNPIGRGVQTFESKAEYNDLLRYGCICTDGETVSAKEAKSNKDEHGCGCYCAGGYKNDSANDNKATIN